MSTSTRSARLGVRATPQQEAVLRRAAEITHKSMTDFILDSACQVAERTLLDQRLFLVTESPVQEKQLLLVFKDARQLLTPAAPHRPASPSNNSACSSNTRC
ncbi:MAG TPA: DUF1778 domain-containing protein [Trinickia sp.]|uniref:type II toxin-antitoxin system TacA family antitoxin n=1 Tax=Trinickia sp. TaxID=2571163 RepID=UPI002CF39E2D|nr:DUF1778 domain-containing protein [Trinickia sp.]HVW50900.1 DUF1778 domain-containing protein [Trinickia sp.]